MCRYTRLSNGFLAEAAEPCGCDRPKLFRLQLHQNPSYTPHESSDGRWRNGSALERRGPCSPMGILRAAEGGKKTHGNIPYSAVFPSQFAHLLIQYKQHPEAKSLAPDGTPCGADTNGLLKRAHVIAGEIRYVGKETDRKWEEGGEISVLEFAATEYGRKGKVVATDEVKTAIQNIGINKCARESGFEPKEFRQKTDSRHPCKTQFLQ